ncbi:MAG TPA: sigma 54-interacting transcriptional regulator, partial [Planctomycetota bacterium]|nr:sigma 54-interacting transcriptional regulator [Planctomycetota bacterium]
LQEREVVPVGSSRPIEWHARIVCATNVDLEARVREGQFRRDLYYRVHVLELRVPPLRERQSDIPLLVESFLERHEARLGPARRISDTALRILEAYPWPGNVRELENVILRASVSATGSVIEPSDLYKVLPLSFEQQDVSDTVFPSYDQLSVDHIVRALRLSRGVQTMAARLLGMDRNRLARLIRRYQIDPRQIARETGRGSRGRRRGRGGDPQREPDAER